MGILAIPINVPVQTAVDVVDDIKRMNLEEYKHRCAFLKKTFDMVWNNKKFTPAQVVIAMGTDAAAIFQHHGQEQVVLATIAQQNSLTYDALVPTNAMTINQDGSITVDMNKKYGEA